MSLPSNITSWAGGSDAGGAGKVRSQPAYFSTYLRTLGGVQSVLRHHLSHDHRVQLDSHLIVLFEANDPQPDRVSACGFTGWTSIRQMRRQIDRLMRGRPGQVAVYHNFWGLPFLADLDRAVRRLGFMHTNPPEMVECLRCQRGWLDGVVCTSPAQQTMIASCLPELSPDRIGLVPLPLVTPSVTRPQPPLGRRPVVIGYSGRLVKEHKRVDRLPRLVRQMEQAGLDFRLELLGDGPARAGLARQFSGSAKVVFHGEQAGAGYWRILSGWDFIVFVSDTEGFSLSLLEALSCGVLPVFPRIPSGGADYAGQVAPECLYPPGDFAPVVSLLRLARQMSPAALEAWRQKGRRIVAPHQGEAYPRAFAQFVRMIEVKPRISPATLPPRPRYLTDYVPVGILRRTYAAGFYRR